MSEKLIAILPGDGIGPEITRETIACLKAVDAKFLLGLTLEEGLIGGAPMTLRVLRCRLQPLIFACGLMLYFLAR